MRLEPFVRVDGLAFAQPLEACRQRLGDPRHEGWNDVQLRVLDYGDVVLRFQASGRLEEVTTRAPVLHLPQAAVPFAALAGFVRSHDAEAFRAGGFLVSPRFGIAFDPADSNWVTALAAHCLPQWRALARARRGSTDGQATGIDLQGQER